MLSILPKHVADEMLKDMKKDESQKDQQQFNTMYMYRHENVRYGGVKVLIAGWASEAHCFGVWFSQALETRPALSVCLGSPKLSPVGGIVPVDGRMKNVC